MIIEDIIITAIEGGINYWATNIQIHNQEGVLCSYQDSSVYGNHFYVTMADAEDPTECFSFTSDDLKKVISETEMDLENYDADDTDILIQLATFGEIVYG